MYLYFLALLLKMTFVKAHLSYSAIKAVRAEYKQDNVQACSNLAKAERCII